MSFQSATPDKNKTEDTWITPKWIIDKIGISDLDPCGFLPEGTPIVQTANNYFTENENGLEKEWFGTVFVNFPYSKSKEWLERCDYFGKKGLEIIVLCFARTETQAWQKYVKSATGINLINRRIKFIDKYGVEKGNGNAPSVLIAWGENAFSKIKNIDGIYLRLDN